MGIWTTWHPEQQGSFWSGTCIFAALATVINSLLWPFTSDIFPLAKSKTVLLPPAPCGRGSFRQWNMLQPLEGGQGTHCWESRWRRVPGTGLRLLSSFQPWLRPCACAKTTNLLVVCRENRWRCLKVLWDLWCGMKNTQQHVEAGTETWLLLLATTHLGK